MTFQGCSKLGQEAQEAQTFTAPWGLAMDAGCSRKGIWPWTRLAGGDVPFRRFMLTTHLLLMWFFKMNHSAALLRNTTQKSTRMMGKIVGTIQSHLPNTQRAEDIKINFCVRQRKTNILLLTCGTLKKMIQMNLFKNRNMFTDIENNLMVTKKQGGIN